MAYRVVITENAQKNLDRYIEYTLWEFRSNSIAQAIIEDALQTKMRLAEIADTLAVCSNANLAELGYRKIAFKRHNFYMLYRIKDDTVIVDLMFHGSQNYEVFLD